MITGEDLAALIGQGREQRAVEFKGPGSCKDKAFLAKVARACMAMSNLRDGGLVVIGVEDSSSLVPVGLDPEALATWASYDNVASVIGKYCDPPIVFELGIVPLNGANFVVLVVKEFVTTPTLAAADYPGILERGLIYVRGMTRIESTGHPTGHELRAVHELAIEKGVRRFVEMAQRAGFQIGATGATDDEAFDEQLGELG